MLKTMKNRVEKEQSDTFNPVPSIFTLFNALSGFTAILLVADGKMVPPKALWLIFVAMLFDVLDGWMARRLNAGSLHGLSLDSLADAISFGAAPAVFIHSIGMSVLTPQGLPALVVRLISGLYLGCALWRLAVYNTRAITGAEKKNHALFVGLPSPAAAAMICCMAWLLPGFSLEPRAQFYAFTIYTLIASLLMVSSVPYLHLRNVLGSIPRRFSLPLLAVALTVVAFYRFVGLVLLAHVYILLPPLEAFFGRLLRIGPQQENDI